MGRRRRRQQQPEGAGEHLRLTVTEMGHQGMALARHENQVVFVAGAIPGETVEAEVTRTHKDYLEAQTVAVLEASPHRVEAPCPYYGECGGCQLQHIDYDHQLELKRQVVADQLRRIGRFSDPPVLPPLASEQPWHYRNQARFTVNKPGEMGFVRRESHRLVPIRHCLLMHDWINRTIGELWGRCAESRAVNLRYGVNTGDYLIQPKIKNPEVSLETGQPAYYEELLGRRFRVASPSFFQVNPQQAERMIELVRGYLASTRPRLLVDAYAGVGTFAALLADSAEKVLALEESGPAVRDGIENVAELANVEFVQGKVEDVLPGLSERPDVVLLDPPRAGCHPHVLQAIADHRPRRVVYVSCDPATLARDLRILVDGGYTLRSVQPVDMFPQTYHIECVSVLDAAD